MRKHPFAPTRTLKLCLQTFVLDLSCTVMNWASEHVVTDSAFDSFRDRLGRWIEDRASDCFGWAYDGSDEELFAVFDNELPLDVMSARQRALLPRDISQVQGACFSFGCHWEGDVPTTLRCPRCNGSLMQEHTREWCVIPDPRKTREPVEAIWP